MQRILATDPASVLKAVIASTIQDVTAGATPDNHNVTGLAIDRETMHLPPAAVLAVYFEAVLGAAKTLAIKNVSIQHSDDGATNWATYLTLTDPGVVATGQSGGSTERGQVQNSVNLSGAKRWVRTMFTPDLSATNTDTCEVMSSLIFTGFDTIPHA
ncbi:MAG TPA: hypothetical protein VM639_24745 [Dongiaceae bacterium]|nr:hypothetical protein [Dongiaceae bacterium]